MSLWLLGRKRGRRRSVYSVSGLFGAAWLAVLALVFLTSWARRLQPPGVEPAEMRDAVASGIDAGTSVEGEPPRSSPPVKRELVLREASWEQVREMVADRAGKVVVVDVWMSTCGPCLERLPHFLELPARLGEDVACITVNCDYGGLEELPVAKYRPDALAALRELDAARAGVDHVLLTDPLLDFMERQNIEATPTLLIFDRTGALAKKFDNSNAFAPEEEFTAEEVEAEIRRVLGEPPRE